MRSRSRVRPFIALALIALLLGGFVGLDLDRHFTLEALKAAQGTLEALKAQAPWTFAAAFFAIYVLVTAASLPGAAPLSLAAGALFGLGTGTVLASFASTLGASAAFLSSRYLLREGVQRRFGSKLQLLNDGIARDGALYLLTLRLVPLFPFFVINLLMGLVPIRLRTFYWVSQLGMLPATLVFVNAGTALGEINRMADIASPDLLLSIALLAVFPWLARAALRLIRRRRLYARWRRPRRFDRNLIVIGGGAAGLVSAYIAAAVKAKVTLIEQHAMGGDCLNTGCVPSKALIRTARLAHQMRHADRYGLEPAEPQGAFQAIMARVGATVRAIAPHDSVERYTRLGVEVIQGQARLIDPWTVETTLTTGGTQRRTARSIVIAAGARPDVPPLPGLDEVGYVTSETLWERFAQRACAPGRLVVLGGGAVGCELAQAFARLGSAVTQVEMQPRLLAREDDDISDAARGLLERDGVRVLLDTTARRCERTADARCLIVAHGGTEQRLEFDELICAVGRRARLDGYGLETLGIATDRTILTNEYLETSYPNIFAAGDVAGPYQFTHMAGHQAWYASVNALFGQFRQFKVDYSAVPWTIFTDPEIARVGLSEREAQSKGIAYELTRFSLAELDRAITDGATDGFVKILTVPGKDRMLGAAVVGEHAGDLLAELALALKHGIGLNKILGTLHSYPTLAEAAKYAAGQWKRAHAPQNLLAWAERYHAWRRR